MLTQRIKSYINRDWFCAALLLIVFLLVAGYKYGWDDQHLEIPLLKSLIDKDLYQGDYYVESLKKNFISYLYPLLARVISIPQIPLAYFLLFLLSRYFLFFWIYKLWCYITKEKFTGFICTLSLLFLGHTPEFFYRTFSHQEFALAFIFAGFYFFYRERFLLTAIILGIATNFHATYSFFVFVYLAVYLLLDIKRQRWSTLLKIAGTYILFSLPLALWIITKKYGGNTSNIDNSTENWITLYKISAPQAFIFDGITLKYIWINLPLWSVAARKYLLLIALFVLNIIFNEQFRRNKKTQAILLTATLFLIASYFFSYVMPVRFIVSLSLIRNTQFLFFILVGYSTFLLIKIIREREFILACFISTLFIFLVFNDQIGKYAIFSIAIILLLRKYFNKTKYSLGSIPALSILFCLSILFLFKLYFPNLSQENRLILTTLLISLLVAQTAICIYYFLKKSSRAALVVRHSLVIAPLLILLFFDSAFNAKFIYLYTKGEGFGKVQRDWEDMQRYVQAHTPKNATLLTPYDMEMGGFRILSDRAIICCARDCGIVGFDYNAALEWARRTQDVSSFKVLTTGDIQSAVTKAIFKYKVQYIVFMHYNAPQGSHAIYRKVYENDSFSLFEIPANAH